MIADRWVQREDPEVFAKRDAIEAEIADEGARLADLEEARYVRGEFTGADAIDRYNRLAGRLRPGSRDCAQIYCGCRLLPWTSLLSWMRVCFVKLGKPMMRPEDVDALASQSIEWKSGEAGWA